MSQNKIGNKIYLRWDQFLFDRAKNSSDQVCIFAPSWVRDALKVLGEKMEGRIFDLLDNTVHGQPNSKHENPPAESYIITKDFNGTSLKLLEQVARNEPRNVSGVINTSLYSDITDVKILYSLRDLVRQCVITGPDNAEGFGGYRCRHVKLAKQRVYICDLAALQFQQAYNTGRLVLIQERDQHKGILDDFIYEKITREKKLSFHEVKQRLDDGDAEAKQRYAAHDGHGLPGQKSCYIDTTAYKKFVALDVVLSGIALSEVALDGDRLLFKFLKYGTGHFAWRFAAELERLILSGVMDGLEQLFEMGRPKVLERIKCVELPFFKGDRKCDERIRIFHAKYGVPVFLTSNDALSPALTSQEGGCDNDDVSRLIVATTNCGDNHAACGNEMGYSGSVDAAIAQNLESRGSLFCANINTSMREQYLDL